MNNKIERLQIGNTFEIEGFPGEYKVINVIPEVGIVLENFGYTYTISFKQLQQIYPLITNK